MPNKHRLEKIEVLVNEKGFLSVGELSERFQVSEMTIRRDLSRLAKQKKIRRTYGGAASLPDVQRSVEEVKDQADSKRDGLLVDRIDVLVATALNPKNDARLLESIGNKENLPIIAESLATQKVETIVAVDNKKAGQDLGRWVGQYASQKWGARTAILDLTYYLSNTQARSQGFIDGVRDVLPEAEVLLSLDAQSRFDAAYQLTRDALTVHSNINVIFAINDVTAWGAIHACKDLNIDPEDIIVVPFGLEGDTLKNSLMKGQYCQAGLAMFPEIVGPVCVEAAIAAYNRQPLPRQLITPYQVLTAENLPNFYQQTQDGWCIRWEEVHSRLQTPLDITDEHDHSKDEMPRRIGFLVPFREHEWYKSMTRSMQVYTSQLGIDFEIVDVHQSLKDEVDLRRREIAHLAVQQVHPGDVVMLDGGPIANYLAEELNGLKGITIITNSIPVFDLLRQNPENVVISTGGAFRHSSQMLVGPTAEGAIKEMRANKFFLMVTGISFNFGLSHTNISEVTMKQAMISSAHEVILLADHSYFGQESIIQVAPLKAVDKLITDDALPASIRLELTKLGIEILLART